MIREKIKEIGDNIGLFKDRNYYIRYSCEYVYKNIEITIKLFWAWSIQGYELIELKIKGDEKYFSDCKPIELSKEEEKYIFKAFKKLIKDKKRKFDNKTDKWSLDKKQKENDLLDSINFTKEKNDKR